MTANVATAKNENFNFMDSCCRNRFRAGMTGGFYKSKRLLPLRHSRVGGNPVWFKSHFHSNKRELLFFDFCKLSVIKS